MHILGYLTNDNWKFAINLTLQLLHIKMSMMEILIQLSVLKKYNSTK